MAAKAPDRPRLIEITEFGCVDGGGFPRVMDGEFGCVDGGGFQRVTDGKSGCVEFGVDFRGRWASRVGRGSRRRTRASSLVLRKFLSMPSLVNKFYNGDCVLNVMEHVWALIY